MEALFKDGEVLRVAKWWLEGTEQLRMANAALIIANLARSGKECRLLDLYHSSTKR